MLYIDADVEDGTLSETEINGFPAVVLQKEGEIRINVSGDAARFYLDGQISYEEAVKILPSIDF